MFVLMRVYFEKPRTTIGWKGLINDPTWTTRSRSRRASGRRANWLLFLADIGLPPRPKPRPDHAAVPVRARHVDRDRRAHDRVADASRNGERALDSGRVKNGTDGFAVGRDQRAAVRAPSASLPRHHAAGPVGVFRTRATANGHMVLRGGGGRPNYDSVSIALCERELEKAGCRSASSSTGSHGNSNKDPGCRRWLRRTSATRSSKATLDRRADAGEQPALGAAADPGQPGRIGSMACPSPMPASTGRRPKGCCNRSMRDCVLRRGSPRVRGRLVGIRAFISRGFAMVSAKKYDLLVKNVRVVRPNKASVQKADVAIADGKFARWAARSLRPMRARWSTARACWPCRASSIRTCTRASIRRSPRTRSPRAGQRRRAA